MVLETGKIVYLALSQGVAPVDQVIDFRQTGLPRKHIAYRLGCLLLELLVLKL
jgi:hypothetical protein